MLGGRSAIKPLSFSQQSAFEPSKLQFDSPKASTASFRPSGLANEYQSSPQRGFHAPEDESEEEDETEEYLEEEEQGRYGGQDGFADEDMDAMADEDAVYEETEELDNYRSDMPGSKSKRRTFDQDSDSDLDIATPEALRDSRLMSLRESTFSTQPKPSMYGKIAKDI